MKIINEVGSWMLNVSFIDKESRNVVMFIMLKYEERWSIIDPQNHPDWLIELEPKLSEIISVHLKGGG
jgi:hypothetical protein